MQPLTGFAHALICQRVALPSFFVLAHGGTHKGHHCQEGVRIWPGGYVLPSGLS